MSFQWSITLGVRAETVSYRPPPGLADAPSPYRRERVVEVKVDDTAAYDDLDCLRAFGESVREAIEHLEKRS
jgi:hypothetical protein